MPDQETVRVQMPDGKLWDIPKANLGKAQQRGAKIYSSPGAMNRAVTSFTGIPEGTDINPASKEFYAGAGNLGNYINAVKQAVSSLNPIPASGDATTTAMAKMKEPGLLNKVGGATEYALSGVPFAGPMAVRAMEQAGKGDIAGSMGSAASAGLTGTGLAKGAPGLVEKSARLLNMPSVAKIPGFESAMGIGQAAESLEREAHQSRLEKIKEENTKTVQEAREKIQKANATATTEHGEQMQSNKVALTAARNEYERTVAAVDRRESLLNEAKNAVVPIAEQLPVIRDQARAVASSLYPEIEGTKDADLIKQGIQREIDTHLQGAGRVPKVLSNALAELTPAPSGERALSSIEERGSIFAKKLIDQGISAEDARGILANNGYLPKQINAIMEVARGVAGIVDSSKISFDKLHGIYSELGAAGFADIAGDEKAAINGARDFVGRTMAEMAEAENKSYRFEQAQKNWAQLQNTFYNTYPLNRGGSPIARALQAFDPITKKLRPEFVHDALVGESEYRIARRMLSKYPDLVRALDTMKESTDKAETLPKQAPQYVVDTGIKRLKPLELDPLPTAKDLELKPEEEFDRLKFRLDSLRDEARALSGMSRYEISPYGFRYVPFRRQIAKILADPKIRQRIAESPAAMKALANAGIIDLALVPRPAPGEENK